MTRNRTIDASITGEKTGFILADLRWLVEQSEDLPSTTEVSLYYDGGAEGAYSQFDRGYASLSVSAKEE